MLSVLAIRIEVSGVLADIMTLKVANYKGVIGRGQNILYGVVLCIILAKSSALVIVISIHCAIAQRS
jgi:hypothetical protein